jgi:2-polyprenyl-3-methyl-5-hydroxy-6-metoxy-1,4-benzoquinol methylase
MVAHLNATAQRVKQTVPLRPGDVVLDIGSNDGTFLRAMREPGALLVGMDPTGSKFADFYPADVLLIPEFFSADRFLAETNRNRAKVVTSIAMFYDLENPLEFMRQVVTNTWSTTRYGKSSTWLSVPASRSSTSN